MMEIKKYGEDAVLINFDNTISIDINEKVFYYKEKLKDVHGIINFIPAYSSLTILFDTNKIPHDKLIKNIKSINYIKSNPSTSNNKITIPVCYDPLFGIDLDFISTKLNITVEEIIETHSSKSYHVYMMGFLPGFGYMGNTDNSIHMPRKENPINILSGSVAIAESQTGIYPADSPGGWQVIGNTPVPIFDTTLDNPFLFQAGDKVIFRPISVKEHESIRKDIIHVSNIKEYLESY